MTGRAPRRGAPWYSALLAALLCLMAGCNGSPPQLEVVSQLAAARSVVALLALGPDGEIVGEDLRPSFETARQRPITREGAPTVDGETLRQSFRVGPLALALGLRLLIARSWMNPDRKWRPLPPLRLVPKDRVIELTFEIAEKIDPSRAEVGVRAFVVPLMPRSRVLDDLEVGEGFVLEGAFGLEPLTRGIAGRPVEFSIVARAGDTSRVLLQEVRDPAAIESFRWTEFRIALDEFVGQTVHLELSSAFRLEPGDDPAQEVAFPAWSVPTVSAPQAADQPAVRNVVLISLDTLRADYVGAYGQPLPTTPNLDRFAGEGALFEHAYTTYPSTTAAHMSMLTGLYPSVHGVYGPTQRVPRAVPLLAELLRARRYRTAAVTEDAMLAAGSGFVRGFDTYREYKSPDRLTDGHVGEVVDSALAWLEQNHRQRFFLFLHTYQVHGPHVAPAEYDVFTSQPAGLKEEFAAVRRGYAGDLLYTDAEIGRLLAGLDALGERERTVVVITADHGEELGEHGVIGHGWYSTDPVLHVPLLVRAPGAVPPGLRLAGSASLVDIAPTILELAGDSAGTPPARTQGVSLVSWMADPEDESRRARAVYTEQGSKSGVLGITVHRERAKWKVNGAPGEQPAHYDLRTDPAERVIRSASAEIAEGNALLERYRLQNEETRAALGQPTTDSVQVDDATQHKLRALGYVE